MRIGGFGGVDPLDSLFWSNRFSKSLTLGLPLKFVAGLFAPSAEGRLSRGEEADRYAGFKAVRAASGRVGCLGVVPFPFDREEIGEGLASVELAMLGEVISV